MEFFHLILIQRDKQEAISIITPRQGSALKVAKKKPYTDHLEQAACPRYPGTEETGFQAITPGPEASFVFSSSLAKRGRGRDKNKGMGGWGETVVNSFMKRQYFKVSCVSG